MFRRDVVLVVPGVIFYYRMGLAKWITGRCISTCLRERARSLITLLVPADGNTEALFDAVINQQLRDDYDAHVHQSRLRAPK